MTADQASSSFTSSDSTNTYIAVLPRALVLVNNAVTKKMKTSKVTKALKETKSFRYY